VQALRDLDDAIDGAVLLREQVARLARQVEQVHQVHAPVVEVPGADLLEGDQLDVVVALVAARCD
jgi:hypothetical protein